MCGMQAPALRKLFGICKAQATSLLSSPGLERDDDVGSLYWGRMSRGCCNVPRLACGPPGALSEALEVVQAVRAAVSASDYVTLERLGCEPSWVPPPRARLRWDQDECCWERMGMFFQQSEYLSSLSARTDLWLAAAVHGCVSWECVFNEVVVGVWARGLLLGGVARLLSVLLLLYRLNQAVGLLPGPGAAYLTHNWNSGGGDNAWLDMADLAVYGKAVARGALRALPPADDPLLMRTIQRAYREWALAVIREEALRPGGLLVRRAASRFGQGCV